MSALARPRRDRFRRALRWTPRYLILIPCAILFLIPFYILFKSAGMTRWDGSEPPTSVSADVNRSMTPDDNGYERDSMGCSLNDSG